MLDARYRDHWLDTLCDLIRTPSRSSSVGGEEGQVQQYVARRMRDAGARVRTFEAGDVPAFFAHPLCCGPDRDYRNRPTVLGEVGPDDAPALLVLAHSDTVQVYHPDKWTRDPFEPVVEDGRVRGLGACDDKYALATILTILQALRDRPPALRRRVIFASTIDEENGVGNGLLLLHLAGVRAEAALYLDGPDNHVLIGQLGGSSIRLTPRKSLDDQTFDAHARALEAACIRMSRSREHLFDRPYYQSNSHRDRSALFLVLRDLDVPRHQIGFYTLPGEDGQAYLQQLHRMIDDTLGPAAADYERSLRQPWFEPVLLDPDLPLIGRVRSAYREVTGRDAVVTTISKQDAFVLTRHAKIPTVSFGAGTPRGPGANHGPDEALRIDVGWDHLRTAHRVITGWLEGS